MGCWGASSYQEEAEGLLQNLHVCEVIPIADAGGGLGGGQGVQEAAGGDTALGLASWRCTVARRYLLPDLAQQRLAGVLQLLPCMHELHST